MAQKATVEGYSKEVTNQYGDAHTLHIDGGSNYTVHKHSGKVGEDDICPYCNDDVDYGHGIEYDGPAFPKRN